MAILKPRWLKAVIMTRKKRDSEFKIDVAIIGGGPAGLAAAVELKRRGITRVVVIERERQAGGIPRHCGHPPFGMREFLRVYTGPQYARKLVKTALAAGVEIRTSTTVVEARPGGTLLLSSNNGMEELEAWRVIYATGVRETPRSARLVSGVRTKGVINTGALQTMVYLEKYRPFKRPVIIGSELVSFSAIQTCRHLGIKPAAMIEQRARATARWPFSMFAPIAMVPFHRNTRLVRIDGQREVEAVIVEDKSGQQRSIECDGVLFTGQFTPEASLARCGHLTIDPATGGPLVDQYGRCSDPAYFAAGNVLRPVETAGWSWNEGRRAGRLVADDLAGKLPVYNNVVEIVTRAPEIKYVMPQVVVLPFAPAGMENIQLRVTGSVKGELVAMKGDRVLWRKSVSSHPERRILVPIKPLVAEGSGGRIELKFTSS